MKNEATIQNEILNLMLGRDDLILRRVNAGAAWQCSGEPVRMRGGVFLPGGRIVKMLPPGTPDIVGVVRVEGAWLPVFIEVKKADGRVSPAQKQVLATLKSMGIRSGVARSVEDAVKIIDG